MARNASLLKQSCAASPTLGESWPAAPSGARHGNGKLFSPRLADTFGQ